MSVTIGQNTYNGLNHPQAGEEKETNDEVTKGLIKVIELHSTGYSTPHLFFPFCGHVPEVSSGLDSCYKGTNAREVMVSCFSCCI
jgi:hypothetical protein